MFRLLSRRYIVSTITKFSGVASGIRGAPRRLDAA
jgi:hypothetical protein